MIKRTVLRLRTPQPFYLVLVLTLLGVLWAAGAAQATPSPKPLAQGGAPTMISRRHSSRSARVPPRWICNVAGVEISVP